MMSKKIVLNLESGLHARPVSKIISFLHGRTGSFTMKYKDNTADCKSAIGLLMLGVQPNAEVEIAVESDNKETDLKDFADFLQVLDD